MGRLIAHVDMNAWFASIEQQANRHLRGKPMGVVRKPLDNSVISAPSYEAKRRGVRTGMPTWEARRVCPEIRIILEDPDKYAYTSERVFSLLKGVTPLVEVFSIDEAFLDLTQPAREWGGPVPVAREIKRRIREELGAWLRCSIGIAPSKVLAKIASESQKPDGLVWIGEEDVGAWLEALPVDEACGIARGIKERLTILGIETLADLGRSDPSKLRREFGIVGIYLHLIGQGKDPAPLHPAYEVPQKSFGHGRVLRFPYPGFGQAKEVLAVLCHKTARRMRARGYCGRVVTFFAAAPGYLRGARKQHTLSEPTADENIIYESCLALARELERRGQLPPELQEIGVSVGELHRRASMPLHLFHHGRKRDRMLDVMDRINGECGDFSVYFAHLHRAKDGIVWNAANRGMYRELGIEP